MISCFGFEDPSITLLIFHTMGFKKKECQPLVPLAQHLLNAIQYFYLAYLKLLLYLSSLQKFSQILNLQVIMQECFLQIECLFADTIILRMREEKYVNMEKLADRRVEWRAASNQSGIADLC